MTPSPPPVSPTSPNISSSTLISSEDAASQPQNKSNVTSNLRDDGSSATLIDPSQHQRRRSVQFNVAGSDALLKQRVGSVKRKPPSRNPSPPPPSAYSRGVSFDTFDNRDATDFSLTLNYKHRDYKASRRSRTFLCGTDQNDYSDFALEWLIDELVDDGDEIVCLRVVEKDSKIASDASVEEGRHRQEAEKLFDSVITKNSQDEKAISLVMELAVGKVQEIIQRMIVIYEPALLIVGTRGRSLGGMQGLLPGSVSKYCLQQSPIPVIVVRPSSKREKKKQKRLADPTRRSYNHILRMSESRGGRLFDKSGSADSSITKLPEEEAAVAEAIGLPPSSADIQHDPRDSRSSLSKDTGSTRSSEEGEGVEDRRDSGVPSPESRPLTTRDLDSPAVSDTEEDDEKKENEKKGEGPDNSDNTRSPLERTSPNVHHNTGHDEPKPQSSSVDGPAEDEGNIVNAPQKTD